jgi:hypothetical protein
LQEPKLIKMGKQEAVVRSSSSDPEGARTQFIAEDIF